MGVEDTGVCGVDSILTMSTVLLHEWRGGGGGGGGRDRRTGVVKGI